MQRVPELVEHRVDLVERHQGRLAPDDVEVVDHHRPGALQARLLHEAVHPRPAPLGRPGVVVAQEQAQRRAVLVAHLEDPHLRVVAPQVGPLVEGDAVEARRRVEDALLQHGVQLEVRSHAAAVDVVAGPAHPLRVERPVPRLDRVPGELLQVRLLLAGIGHRGRHEPVQHLGDGPRRAGGLVGQDVLRVVLVAEQPRPLPAQGGHLPDEAGVPGAASGGGAVDPLAQGPVGQLRQGGLPGGQDQRDQISAVQAALRGLVGERLDRVRREPVELGDVLDHHRALVGVGEQVPLERGPEGREALVDVPEPALVPSVQRGARPGEVGEVALQQPPLLLVGRLDRLDALEQPPVEVDRVGVLGEPGRDGLLDLLHARSGVGRRLVEEHRRDAVEQRARPLQRLDGVLERRRLRVRGDLLDLREVLGHALLERRRVVLLPDLLERRQPVRQVAGTEEGVRGRGHGGRLLTWRWRLSQPRTEAPEPSPGRIGSRDRGARRNRFGSGSQAGLFFRSRKREPRGPREQMGYGVIGSPTDSGSVSLGSSPGTPAGSPKGFCWKQRSAWSRRLVA